MWPEDLQRLDDARGLVLASFENGEPRPSLGSIEEVACALLQRYRELDDSKLFDAFYGITARLFASYTMRTISKLRARVEWEAVTNRLYTLIFEKLVLERDGIPFDYFLPWCYRTIVNLTREENRKAGANTAPPPPEPPPAVAAESAMDRLIAREDRDLNERLLQRVIEILAGNEGGFSERDRLVMHHFYFDEMSLKEIAAKTGLTQSNVGVILKRTRDRIAKLLCARPLGEDPFAPE